ncbi:MAG: MFS transporter [Planctomycetota bacterium]|nr:MFS transporter [Planctomycetota bacterium]
MSSSHLTGHPDADRQPSRARYLIALLIATGAVSLYLTRHCLAVTNEDIQQDLGFGSTAMGAVMGLFSLGYLLFQVPGGWLGNRIGSRWGLTLLSIAWSLLTLATAAAHDLLPLKVIRFMFGAVQAGYVPITAKILKDWFPEKQWGLMSAFVGISMSIGGALAMDVTGRLTGHFDWRVIFQVYTVVALFWSIAFVTLFRNTPAEHPWANKDEQKLIQADGPPEVDDPGPFFTRRNLLFAFCSVNLWAICIQSFFRAAGYNFFVTFFPEFLSRKFVDVDASQAGIYTKWPLIGVVVGGLAGGLLIDWLFRVSGSKRISRTAVAVISLVLTAIFTCLSAQAATITGFITLIALGAAFSGFASPATWAATLDVGGKHTAVVAGIMNMAGCMSGVLVTPILGAMMDILKKSVSEVTVRIMGVDLVHLDNTQVTSWSQVVYMHAAFYLAAAICWIFVRPSRPVVPGPEAPLTPSSQ